MNEIWHIAKFGREARAKDIVRIRHTFNNVWCVAYYMLV